MWTVWAAEGTGHVRVHPVVDAEERGVRSDPPPSCPPSCVQPCACDGVSHAHALPLSVLRELRRHGDHPDPGDPHLVTVYRPLHVWVSRPRPSDHRTIGPSVGEVCWLGRAGRAEVAGPGHTRGVQAWLGAPSLAPGPRPAAPEAAGVPWAAVSSPSAWTV